jgi:thiamine pyrophosphate-dependent acetolactate synthase large subunit-like protein
MRRDTLEREFKGQGSLETGVHWSKNTRLDKVAEGFGCYGEYAERDGDIAPAIKRAYARDKPGVIHPAEISGSGPRRLRGRGCR